MPLTNRPFDPELSRRIDELCDRFEIAWRAGDRPPIAPYLADLPDVARSELLSQLLAIELGYCTPRDAGAPAGADQIRASANADTGENLRSDQAKEASLLGPTQAFGCDTTIGNSYPSVAVRAYAPSRFRVLRSHARGGLGEIFVARDEEIGRNVALKEMLPDKAASHELRLRFVLEAEINGNLEHPGIVPVYGLGVRSDGRPFYAMRLIEGESLKEAIERFHAPGASPNGSAGALDLRRLLGRFVDVCEAIGYAHSRGVLHRDLKPANVMLGRFGETLIIDWGLAKSMARSEEQHAAEAAIVPPSGSGIEPTQAGMALGTPAYMSPEQADGLLTTLGPATDIYGLGATLYALLTGLPPCEGKSVPEILARVREGRITPPFERKGTAPKALSAVCMKALAPRPEDRYASALELAADIERWLADEPVTAWSEPIIVRTRRFMRRHRTAAAVAASLFVLGTAALIVSNVLVDQQRARAEANFGMAREAVDDMYTQVAERWLSEQAQLEPLQRDFLQKALRFYERSAQSIGVEPNILLEAGRAARRVGEIQRGLGDFKAAEVAYLRSQSILQRLVEAHQNTNENLFELAVVSNRLGELHRHTGRDGEHEFRTALSLTASLLKQSPGAAPYRRERALAHSHLGTALAAAGMYRDAEFELRAALDLRQALVNESSGDFAFDLELSRSWASLGVVLKTVGRIGEAEFALRQAVTTTEHVVQSKPRDAVAKAILARQLDELAKLLCYCGRDTDALPYLRRAEECSQALVVDFPKILDYRDTLAIVQRDLANTLRDSNLLERAGEAYSKAIEIAESLVNEYPNVPSYLYALAVHHSNLAWHLRIVGEQNRSELEHQLATDCAKRLARDYPRVVEYKQIAGEYLHSQALFLRADGRASEAEPLFLQAVEALETAVSVHPEVVELRRILISTYNAQAEMFRVFRRFLEARQVFQKAAPIADRLASDHPGVPSFSWVAAMSYFGLLEVAEDLSDFQGTRELQNRMVYFAESTGKQSPSNTYYQAAQIHVLGMVARGQLRLGEVAAAEHSVRQIVELPKSPQDHYNAACPIALCARVVQEAPIPESQRAELRQSFGDLAMDLLRESFKRGYRNPGLMRTDPDLLVLHGRADFQALLMDSMMPADPFARQP